MVDDSSSLNEEGGDSSELQYDGTQSASITDQNSTAISESCTDTIVMNGDEEISIASSADTQHTSNKRHKSSPAILNLDERLPVALPPNPPNLTNNMNRNGDGDGVPTPPTAQASGEPTREVAQTHKAGGGHPAQQHSSPQQQEAKFEAELEHALQESLKEQMRGVHHNFNRKSTSTECIDLCDSDDEAAEADNGKIPANSAKSKSTLDDEEEDDRKMPANNNVDGNTEIKSKPSAISAGSNSILSNTNNDSGNMAPTATASASVAAAASAARWDNSDRAASVARGNNDNESEEDQLKRAIQESLEEEQNAKQAYSMSPERISWRKLSRNEFENAVDLFVDQQGGYERIEHGALITHGNSNAMKKSRVADGGGKNQTGAQYGRYTISATDRLFNVLEGEAGINIDKEIIEGTVNSVRESPGNKKEKKKTKKKRKLEKDTRLSGLPGAKIKAFVDIGHGIGIQVLQAAWTLGVPSRGVEIMKDRHLVAEAIREGVLEGLRENPPDSTLVDLTLADFSRAVVSEDRDERLRSFLLFHDNMMAQDGLVIFINNAEEVFAARSKQNTKPTLCLDAHLANLFANMQVGGRMVTLTDVSSHLCKSSAWFQKDIFQSGTGAVSWGDHNKDLEVHVLTKLSSTWTCQNKKCEGKLFGSDNAIVDDKGDLIEQCLYCNVPAKRCSRVRKPARKKTED